MVQSSDFESSIFVSLFWKSFSSCYISETRLILATFFAVAFFHFCDKNHKMTPIWKQKRITDDPEYFLFSNSHGPSHFLACISSKRTLCTTLFSSKVCKLCFPYVDLFHFWNFRESLSCFVGKLQKLQTKKLFSKAVNQSKIFLMILIHLEMIYRTVRC